MKSWPHRLPPTCKPSSPRPRNGPHHGLQCQMQLWNLPRPNALAARAGITIAQEAAPTHQLRSTLTLPQPRSLPVPRSQPRRNRTSLPRVVALTSTAVPPPCLLSQLDISGKRPAQKTPANSTPTSPLAQVGLMAFAVQLDPSVLPCCTALPPSITLTPLGLGTPRQW